MRLSQAEDDRKQAQKNKVFRARQKRRSDTALFLLYRKVLKSENIGYNE